MEELKQLREETGLSVMECKKALDQAGGNLEKARELLRSMGKRVAEKKHDREVGEGLIDGYLHSTGKVGVLVDVRCETDFVAKSDDFKSLCHELALQVASMNPENEEELLGQQYIKDPSKKVRDLLEGAIAKLGENIVVKRIVRLEI